MIDKNNLKLKSGVMKNFLLKQISFGLVIIVLLMACSKEAVESNDGNKDASAQFTGEDPKDAGSVIGIILPSEAQPVVYMFGKTTVKIGVNADGTIAANSVPAGDYTVQIHANNPAYGDVMINDIRVEAGKTTDLGTIVLVKTSK